MKAAQDRDRAEFQAHLGTIVANEEAIWHAIQHQNGAHRRVEDLLVAILQVCRRSPTFRQPTLTHCIQRVDRLPPENPEVELLENVSRVLQRRSTSSRSLQELRAEYIISSYDVEIYYTEKLGNGGFGQVFRGRYTGAVSASPVLLVTWLPRDEYCQAVAIKRMWVEVAENVSDDDRKVSCQTLNSNMHK